MNSGIWVSEDTGNYMKKSFRVERILFSEQGPYQSVQVIESPFFGRILLNDGLVMVSERDEFVYHEMMAHVPLFTHPNPKNVLIIGGGDGGTAREVLRHNNVEKCVMVEIDESVIRACKAHISQTAEILQGKDKRLNLIIGDGVKFVGTTQETFDVVLIDSTDPIGPATPLFGPEFYRDVHGLLREGGIVVSQGESPWHNEDIQRSLMGILHNEFPLSLIYTFNNTTYCDGLWCFTFASTGPHPLKDFYVEKVKNSRLSFRYYNEDIHKASFVLPNFIRKNLQGFLQS